jgi:hypothetical protein
MRLAEWRAEGLVGQMQGPQGCLDVHWSWMSDRRRHATVELAIRDLSKASGLRHYPSGTSLPTPPGP